MNKEQKQQDITKQSNVLYTLLGAVNFNIGKYINKLSNRIRCILQRYWFVYVW
jgi:hypothetical protein